MASLYADESFPAEVVEVLRRLGHDVLTSLEAGQANQGIRDDAVLEFATRQGRAVLTMNRWDFIQLHSRLPQHAGMVVCTQDADVERQGTAIDAAIRRAGTLDGVLLRINRPT